MDPVTFIQTLPSELRRSVLEDMEDSVLAVMPPDIAAEAQALRREQEARQRQLMHERLFGHSSTSALSAILRSPAPPKSSKSPPAKAGESTADPRMATTGLTESQLQLSVEVLTSHSCSEEGLEDAANVLLQLSRGDPGTRDTVLRLLLSGARQLGATLCRQIGTLLAELREYNLEQQRRAQSEVPSPEGVPDEQPPSAKLKGKMQSRFDTAESVVIVASQKRALGGRELQLPSMSVLTSKTSTQRFFLRVLQVIIQLRDDTRRAHKKAKQAGRLGSEGPQGGEREERPPPELPLLSEQLCLDELWDMLGECLKELEESHDQHAVLETHRTVLNQILRQSTTHLADGPFAVLVDYIRVLDFDVKRKYFRQELERLDEGLRKEDMAVHVRRDHVFEDSYRELHRKSPEEMKNRLPLLLALTSPSPSPAGTLLAELREYNLEQQRRAQSEVPSPEGVPDEQPPSAKLKGKMQSRYIVFEGEEGQDAGGLLREWYMIISREMFNPMYALFRTSPGDRVTYTINPSSHCNPNHLSYFKFVGRIVAKAVYDNRLLECYFTRSFYKHILGKSVRYTDMESEDYHFYQGLVYLLENDVSTLGYDLTFSTEVQEFGVCEVRDLKPNGANVLVTEENKKEYVHLVCQMRMTGETGVWGAIRKQLAAFLEGFYEIIPKRLISIFTEQELELLISGLPTIDIDDLKANTEYHKYQGNSIQPAVEAFFLVHATERESKPPVRDTRESQLAHIKDEPPPLSPAPLTPATPSSLDPFFSREPSSMHISASLPPDTQKFLRFAGAIRKQLAAFLEGFYEIIPKRLISIFTEQELELLISGLPTIDIDDLKANTEYHKYQGNSIQIQWFWRALRSFDQADRAKFLQFVTGTSKVPLQGFAALEGMNGIQKFQIHRDDRSTDRLPSAHTCYFKFVGRIVAKAVYDNRLLECYFTRSFYKHILGKSVRYTDMESEDYHFYQGLVYLLENDVSTLGYDLTFSTEVHGGGNPTNGSYRALRTWGWAIRKQLAAFLEGFYEIIPKRLISIFTEQELELLISGLPTIDIDDLKANTEYHKYQGNSIQIQWFWRALRSFDQADRAKFLQFVTGTSKVPLQGFAALEGMNGIQKFQIHRDDRSTDRLPSAHTCFNQLDLPAYESYEKLRQMLLLAIQECSEGFGLA
ncbi:UNVERIFIED_CONTAM: hypothetical protein H355_007776 [Colinus virginianus]|nr:hypothetical protein H355_007776 [Colinus virginianus]